MFSYIIKRILLFIPTILLVSCIAFLLSKMIPKDPAAISLNLQGIDFNNPLFESELIKVRQEMNLHLPSFYLSINQNHIGDPAAGLHYPSIAWNGFKNQYHIWLKEFLNGEFGTSFIDKKPVEDKIDAAFGWTALLLLLNFIFSILIAFPLGVYNGMNKNSFFDRWSNKILYGIFAMPTFWLATICIIFFTTSEYGSWTNIFPTVGFGYLSSDNSFWQSFTQVFPKLILPLLIIVLKDSAYISRMIRGSIIEEQSKPYIRALRSKGLSERQLAFRHLLPNSLIPTITLIAGTLPVAFGGSLIIEVIFNIPGMGKLMFDSVIHSDWAIVYPLLLLISLVTMISFLVADILVARLNPKINFS